MGSADPDAQNDATHAMMVARALKKEDTLNNAIFEYIHVQRSAVTGLKDSQNIFIVNGVEPENFDKLAKRFGVNSTLQKK
jgi:thiol:disulfide interchange protein DsbA